jgi:hypothetical protein
MLNANSVKNYDTKLYKNRLRLGTKSENYFKGLINEDFILTPRFEIFDYELLTETKNIYIELKSRTVTKNKYKTTICGYNKIEYYNKLNTFNKSFYIFFGFVGENDMYDYYFIEYDKKQFDTFNTMIVNDKKHMEIDVDLLKPLSDFEHFIRI